MNLFSSFGDSTTFALSRAILVYEGKTPAGSTCVATLHDMVTGEDGRAEIQPGACAQPEAVQDLALALLEQSGKLELLPPTLLALGIKGMIWHCPPAVRQLWFAPFAVQKGEKDEGQAALKRVSGERFPQPHLVFRASPHGLSVFALRGTAKPTAKSPLYQAPYWNISSGGVLCIGNARITKGATPSQMPRCEQGFFESNFTHSNCHASQLVKFPGGHNALWPKLKGKRTFPEEVLVPLKQGRKAQTVGDLL